jgi:hypothetical protein
LLTTRNFRSISNGIGQWLLIENRAAREAEDAVGGDWLNGTKILETICSRDELDASQPYSPRGQL